MNHGKSTRSPVAGRLARQGRRLPALIALLGGLLLTWRWLEAAPLWLDEEMLALNLRGRTFAELAAPLWLNQSAPLGWLWLERAALLLFGSGERALRLLPLLCGLGTLACAAWVGARWLGALGGAVLVLLCAFAPWLAYHALELKPYSSDALWALLLPALAAWVLDTAAAAPRHDAASAATRVLAWWALAAISLWLANAAALVAPACALVLFAGVLRRLDLRVALTTTLAGSVAWLASFWLHYHAATGHAVASRSLQGYWSFAMSPAGASVLGRLEWIVTRLQPLAEKPGGTTHPWLFWLAVLAGVALAARSRAPGRLLPALIPLSAFALGALRLVPLYERLSLWIVPSLYVALAALAEGALRLLQGRPRHGRAAAKIAAAAALACVVALSVDVARNGRPMLLERRTDDAHGLDDRAGVGWLMKQRRPGDAVVTTRLALPAVWWYGGASWTPDRGLRTADGAAVLVLEADLAPTRSACAAALESQLGAARRLLVYLGFRRDDWPAPRENVLLARLGELGGVTAYRPFAEIGSAMVVDRGEPAGPWPQLPPRPWVSRPQDVPPSSTCVDVRLARPR